MITSSGYNKNLLPFFSESTFLYFYFFNFANRLWKRLPQHLLRDRRPNQRTQQCQVVPSTQCLKCKGMFLWRLGVYSPTISSSLHLNRTSGGSWACGLSGCSVCTSVPWLVLLTLFVTTFTSHVHIHIMNNFSNTFTRCTCTCTYSIAHHTLNAAAHTYICTS